MLFSAIQDNYTSSFIVSGRKFLTANKKPSPSLEAKTGY
jgi:hypothetical protein